MIEFFSKRHKRINIVGNDIFIDNKSQNIGKGIDLEHIFSFTKPVPELNIFENNSLSRRFTIETLINNPDLTGQFLHSSIRILPNSAVVIDGIISSDRTKAPKWTESNYEAIRFQPFYLSNANYHNLQLIGKGLFDRGLHFSGTITPASVRNVCICDFCSQSFTIQHFHAGFSESQYFYSSDSKETLIVPYGAIENMPVQLQKEIDQNIVDNVDSILPKPSNGEGSFNYYNPFRCPHCSNPYIDFKGKLSRPNEYYGNFYINQKPKHWVPQSTTH